MCIRNGHQNNTKILLVETSIVPTTTIRSGTDNNYKLLINGNEVKYDKTKNEMSINVNVNVNINNK
jgi:hypothetical protein